MSNNVQETVIEGAKLVGGVAAATSFSIKVAIAMMTGGLYLSGGLMLKTIVAMAIAETVLTTAIFAPVFITTAGIVASIWNGGQKAEEEFLREEIRKINEMYSQWMSNAVYTSEALPLIPNNTVETVPAPNPVNQTFRAELNKGQKELAKPFIFKTAEYDHVISYDFRKGEKAVIVTRVNKDGNLEVGSQIVKTYYVRQYSVLVFGFKGEGEEERVVDVFTASQALLIIAREISKTFSYNEAAELLEGLLSKVLVNRKEAAHIEGRRFYGGRVGSIDGSLDINGLIEAHKVGLVGIDASNLRIVTKKDEDLESLNNFNGRELDKVGAYFNKLGLPLVCDKNNKKFFIFGDGARAMGVDLVDGKLVSLNIMDEDNAKTLNRISSHSYQKADNVRLLVDGKVQSAITTSNFAFALSNGQKVAASGVEMPVFVHTGKFNLDNGIMQTNAARDVKFVIEQVKRLPAIKVNIYSFSEEYRNTLGRTHKGQVEGLRKALAEYMTNYAKSNPYISANSIITFNDVVIIANPFHFDVKFNDIVVRLGSPDFNKTIRTIEIEVTGNHTAIKKSPKVRGLNKKATAFPSGVKITDAKGEDQSDKWAGILNREAIKGSSTVLDIYANAHLDEEFVWSKGVLTANGEEITTKEAAKWVSKQMATTYYIKRPADASIVALAIKEGLTIETIGGINYVVEKVQGFFGHSVMEVEVSTADENHGVSYLGINELSMLAMAFPKIAEFVVRHNKAVASKAELLTYEGSIPKFNLPQDLQALRKFFAGENFGTKSYMGSLANKKINGISCKHGINIKWNSKVEGGSNTVWNLVLPFGILKEFGIWTKGGRPAGNYGGVTVKDEQGEDKVIGDILTEVFELITAIQQEAYTVEERKAIFIRSNYLKGWVEGLRTGKIANHMVKAGYSFHQKVVADYTIGTKTIGENTLPVVRIHPSNPMVQSLKLDGKLKEGQAVVKGNKAGTLTKNRIAFLSRCPLPLFTAVFVEFDDSLDNSVIAVNPLVWIKSNFGDFDGDLGYLADALQFGVNSPMKAAEFNEKFSAMNMSNEGTNIIKKLIEEDEEIVTKWTNFNNKIEVGRFANLGYAVHNHYKINVGKLYNIACELTTFLSNKQFVQGGEISETEMKALIQAWVAYESIGLSGYTKKNANFIEELEAIVKAIVSPTTTSNISKEDREKLQVDFVVNNSVAVGMKSAMEAVGIVHASGVLGLIGLIGILGAVNDNPFCDPNSIQSINRARKAVNKAPLARVEPLNILGTGNTEVEEQYLAAANSLNTSRFGTIIRVIGELRTA